MPVLLKGWFVKLWGTSPLLFAESLKVLSPIPWRAEIIDNVANRRRLTSDESWLYHETLRQLQVTSLPAQRELAREQQLARMKQLRPICRCRLLLTARSWKIGFSGKQPPVLTKMTASDDLKKDSEDCSDSWPHGMHALPGG